MIIQIFFQKNNFLAFGLLLHISVLGSQQAIATIPVGSGPTTIVNAPNGQLAYVVNMNHKGPEDKDSISVINLATNKVVDTITDLSFNQPYIMAINSSGTTAYVTNSGGTTVSVLDLTNNTVSAVIDGFDGPSGIAITPDGDYAYVTNYGNPSLGRSGKGSTVQIIDLQTNTVLPNIITTAQAPTAATMSPDGKYVYVLCYVTGKQSPTGQHATGSLGDGVVEVISTTTNQITTTITGFFGPYDMVITSDGKYGYVSNFGSTLFFSTGIMVSCVDLTKNSIIQNIKVGMQPSGLAFTPDQKLLYVTNYNTLGYKKKVSPGKPGKGIVSIINVANPKLNTVLPQTLTAGKSPAAISISSNGKSAYVVNYNSDNVSVFNISQITKQKKAPKNKAKK